MSKAPASASSIPPSPIDFPAIARTILDDLERVVNAEAGSPPMRGRGKLLDSARSRILELESRPKRYTVRLTDDWKRAARETVEGLLSLFAQIVGSSKDLEDRCGPTIAKTTDAIRAVETANWGTPAAIRETIGFPRWLRTVSRRVCDLLSNNEIRAFFENTLHTWLQKPANSRTDRGTQFELATFFPERALSDAEKTVYLSAIHDAVCKCGRRVDRFDPGRAFKFPAEKLRIPYAVIRSNVRLIQDVDRAEIESILDSQIGRYQRPGQNDLPIPKGLIHPIKVADISRNVPKNKGGGRSDKIADRLERHKARMQKRARFWYVEREDLERIIPAAKKWLASLDE